MGGVPSKESKTFYSYFRGTYEIGLIPLTKAFFAVPHEKAENGDEVVDNNNISGARHFGKATFSASQRASTLELRRQFLQMRNDPVILYLCSRKKTISSWKELLSATFTEKDLDNYLDEVEKMLYETDADMVMDSNSPIFPVPCALCLVCKEGQERFGSFAWHGRSVVVVGFFGVMSDKLRRAFKINTYSSSMELSEDGNGNLNGSVNGENSNNKNRPQVSLYLNAHILASAGDRTLERVLVLAPVMLRNQYLDSFVQVYSSLNALNGDDHKIKSWEGKLCDGSGIWSACSNYSQQLKCLAQKGNNNGMYLQLKERVFSSLERRLSFFSVHVETHIDNYSFLKCLSENVAFLQSQADVDPKYCTMKLPKVIFDKLKKAEIAGVDDSMVSGSEECPANVEGIQESSNGTTEAMESVGNDTKASCSDAHDNMTELFGAQQTSCTDDTLQNVETSLELIRICFLPEYVVKAAMWASGLLLVPTKLCGGRWIQYKLKDENDKLRKKLHEKDSIVATWRDECKDLANSYLGKNTPLLLSHVKALQEEVEKARALPLTSWEKDRLIQTREGRTCALHNAFFGTMLVGIRGRGDSDEVSRVKKKGNLFAEKSSSPAGDNGAGTHSTQSFDKRVRVGGHSSSSSTPAQSGVFLGSAVGGMPFGNVMPNMTSMPGVVEGSGNIQPSMRINACGGCFYPSYTLMPQMQPPCNLPLQTNIPQTSMMFSSYVQNPGNAAFFADKKEQPEAPTAPQQMFYYFPVLTQQLETGAKLSGGEAWNSNISDDAHPSSRTVSQSADVMSTRQYPFPFSTVSGQSASGVSFSPVGNIALQQQQQQQQQVIFVQQSPVGQPIFAPAALARPQTNLPPPYGHPLGDASVAPRVVIAPQPLVGRESTAGPLQMVVAPPAVAPAGMPPTNYVYYVTTPTESC